MEGINRQTLFFEDLIWHIEKMYASNHDFIKGKFEGYRAFLEFLGLEYYPLGIVSRNFLWVQKIQSLYSNFTYVIYSEHLHTLSELIVFDSEYKLKDITTYDELKVKLCDLNYSFLHKEKISSDRFIILHKNEDMPKLNCNLNFRFGIDLKDPDVAPKSYYY